MSSMPIRRRGRPRLVKEGDSATGPGLLVTITGDTSHLMDGFAVPDSEPLRELRLRAKLAGVRVLDWHTREFLVSEIARLGEFQCEDQPYRILETGRDLFVAELECGLVCFVGQDGFFKVEGKLNGRHGFDSFRDSLDLIAIAADEYFDVCHQSAISRHEESIVQMEDDSQYDGMPAGPTPEDQRIIDFADREIGVRNCNFTHCVIAVAQAYGLPLGESRDPKEITDEVRRPDNANVMYDLETLKKHVLKAMEKPL